MPVDTAMVAPKEVGLFLARQYHVEVKILLESEEESPVGIAVKRGNLQLVGILDAALVKLIEDGKIRTLYKKWFK